MSTYKDNASYSLGLINTIGPENLTQLPFDAEDSLGGGNSAHQQSLALADLLGACLATASTTWSEKESQDATNKIVESVNSRGHYGRITVLNEILDGDETNEDHVDNLKFSKTFLIQMGKELEKIDYDAIRSNYSCLNDGVPEHKDLGEALTGHPHQGTLFLEY